MLGHVLQLRHGSTKPRLLVPPGSGVQDAGDCQDGLHGDRRRAFVQASERGHVVHLTGAHVKRCNGGGCAGKMGGQAGGRILRLYLPEGPA